MQQNHTICRRGRHGLADQRGQALAEVAVAVPLFVIVLLAVAYFSQIVYTQQRLNVAVRYAAREMAIASTQGDLNRLNGAYILRASGDAKTLVARAMGVDTSGLTISPVNTPDVVRMPGLRFLPGGYVALFLATGSAGNLGTKNISAEFGAGVLFYGCKATYRLRSLDWVARALDIKEGITLQASSLMPAELPLDAAGGYGLRDLNRWVKDLALQDPNQTFSDRQLMNNLYGAPAASQAK